MSSQKEYIDYEVNNAEIIKREKTVKRQFKHVEIPYLVEIDRSKPNELEDLKTLISRYIILLNSFANLDSGLAPTAHDTECDDIFSHDNGAWTMKYVSEDILDILSHANPGWPYKEQLEEILDDYAHISSGRYAYSFNTFYDKIIAFITYGLSFKANLIEQLTIKALDKEGYSARVWDKESLQEINHTSKAQKTISHIDEYLHNVSHLSSGDYIEAFEILLTDFLNEITYGLSLKSKDVEDIAHNASAKYAISPKAREEDLLDTTNHTSMAHKSQAFDKEYIENISRLVQGLSFKSAEVICDYVLGTLINGIPADNRIIELLLTTANLQLNEDYIAVILEYINSFANVQAMKSRRSFQDEYLNNITHISRGEQGYYNISDAINNYSNLNYVSSLCLFASEYNFINNFANAVTWIYTDVLPDYIFIRQSWSATQEGNVLEIY